MKLTIQHLDYRPLPFVTFCAGVCFGELIGILMGIFDRDWTGVISGACLGVAFGISLSIFSLIAICIFNTFAPMMGGWKIHTNDYLPANDHAPIKN